MARQGKRSAEARIPLTRERVLRSALALADEGGIEALTMRRLGEAVGVEAMSLYNHVANKEDLLAGLIDIVFGEIHFDCDSANWKTAMRQRAISARDVLARHQWAIGLMESGARPGPATLRHHDSVLRCLREAGFSIVMTAHAYSALDSYIYGFALQQRSLPLNTGDDTAKLAASIASQFAEGEYPYLVEFAGEHVMKPGYSYAAEFEFGLNLILDGVEKARQQEA